MNNFTDSIFIFGAKYLYLFVIVIALIWFLVQAKPRKKETLVIACICLPLVFIISELVSHLYYNSRPFVAGNFQPLIHHAANNGFPSHHALLVSSLASVVFVFSRPAGFVLWSLVLLVGFSRVYTGVHHLIDIAASMLISIIAVNGVYFSIKHLKKLKNFSGGFLK